MTNKELMKLAKFRILTRGIHTDIVSLCLRPKYKTPVLINES